MNDNDYAVRNMLMSLRNVSTYASYLEDYMARDACEEVLVDAVQKIRKIFEEYVIKNKQPLNDQLEFEDNSDDIRLKKEYDFVKVGAKVWWNDPEFAFSSGIYEVKEIYADTDGKWCDDTMLLLWNGVSEVECTFDEVCRPEG